MVEPATVLVVDDDVFMLRLLSAQLQAAGHRVLCAQSGEEGLEFAAREELDVVLSDVLMPGMDGFELCKRLKERAPHTPIVMLTRLNDKRSLEKGLEAGADEFLTKPVHEIELRARIDSMLRVREQFKALKKGIQIREDMVHMLVHDMRSPLTAIQFLCDWLQDQPEAPLTEEDREALRASSRTLTQLVDQILMVARGELGDIKVKPVCVELGDFLKTLIQSHLRPDSRSARRIVLECEEGSAEVYLDVELMSRVVDNLLGNAAKYSPRGSVVVVSVQCVDNELSFMVKDQGPGIPRLLRDKVFERFGVVELRRRDIRQTGLGLAFCKLAVEAHGGAIWVEDNSPQGSVFCVKIPQPEKRAVCWER